MSIFWERRHSYIKETLGFYKTFKDIAYSTKVVERGKKYSEVSERYNTWESNQKQSHLVLAGVLSG